MQVYDTVAELEKRVADYAGAWFGVAVNSCTSAIMLCASMRFQQGYSKVVTLPRYTYVGVAQAILCAGGTCRFGDNDWEGQYLIPEIGVIDSARRFRSQMYRRGLCCLSFHETKHLPIGRGGMILTNDETERDILTYMRFDGRTPGVAPKDDTFEFMGFHVHMKPDDAARGLMFMSNIKDDNPDLPWGPGTNSDYADLSQFPLFQEGPWL